MKESTGEIFYFRHCGTPAFVKYDGGFTDSILNAVGFLKESDADVFMLRQPEPVIACVMPVWEWLTRCNEARDGL